MKDRNQRHLDKMWFELDEAIHNTCPIELIEQYKTSIKMRDGLAQIIEPMLLYCLRSFQEDHPPEEKCTCPRNHGRPGEEN